jgi:hypothetical protein
LQQIKRKSEIVKGESKGQWGLMSDISGETGNSDKNKTREVMQARLKPKKENKWQEEMKTQ